MKIEFQQKITDRLNRYDDVKDFPKSNLLIGERGSGTGYLSYLISKKYGFEYEVLNEAISKNDVDEFYIDPIPTVYLIDIPQISKKKRIVEVQNSILKFVEEPPENSIICISVYDKRQVLDTIINRCTLWEFEPYSIETLKKISPYMEEDSSDFMYMILNTPGKLSESKELNRDKDYYDNLEKLCVTIINNISRANLSNTLSLEKHLNLTKTKDPEKYDLETFFIALSNTLKEELVNSFYDAKYKSYLITIEYINRLNTLNIDVKSLFYSFMTKLKAELN